MQKKQLLVLIFTLFSMPFIAQNSEITGYVLDKQSDEVLSNASVHLEMENKEIGGEITNEKGEFAFKNLKEGKYHLQIKYLGYFPQSRKITLKKGEVKKINIYMEVDIKNLLAVEIIDDKIENTPYSKVTIKKEEMEKSSVKDIGEFLRTIPNLHSVRKGGVNMDPVIRGYKFSQLNIIADNGLSIEGGCPNRMDPTTAHVEAGDIEAIEVLKGPHALRFGPNFGGVINMHTINPRPFKEFQVHVKGNIGFESNWNGEKQHLTVLGGGEKVFFALTGNNHNYGNYTDGEGNKVRSRFQKTGYTAKLGFSPAKNHIVYATYSQFYANNVAFSALPMDERFDDTKLYSIDYRAKDINKTISSLFFKAYYTDVDHTMDNKERSFGDTVAAVANIGAQRMGYRAEAGLNVFGGHLFIGSDYRSTDKDGKRDKNMIIQPPTPMGSYPVKVEKLWNNANITNLGVFGEYKREFGKIEMIAALRADFNSAYSDSISLTNMMGMDLIGTTAEETESSYTNFSFSLGGSYSITEKLTASLSLGRGVRSPDMIERFIISLPVGYDNYEYLGNPQLKPEANNELDISLKRSCKRSGAFELTGFYSIVQDYITGDYVPTSEQKPMTQSVVGVKRFENMGTANLYGFEFGYTSPNQYKLFAKLTAAYTAGHLAEGTYYTINANNDVTDSETIKNDPLSEIPPFETNLFLGYKINDSKFIPELKLRYVADQNRISEIHYEPTSPGFFLADFTLTYNHNKYFSVVGGVNNIFDNAYFEHLNRRVIGTNTRIYEPGRVLFVNLIFNI